MAVPQWSTVFTSATFFKFGKLRKFLLNAWNRIKKRNPSIDDPPHEKRRGHVTYYIMRFDNTFGFPALILVLVLSDVSCNNVCVSKSVYLLMSI